jgi:hypothetical protein
MIAPWRVSNPCNLARPFCGYDKRLGLPRGLLFRAAARSDFMRR